MVIRSSEEDTHSSIVYTFSWEINIRVKLGERGIYHFPEDSLCKIVGAGNLEVDSLKRKVFLDGKSQGYNIGINQDHAMRLNELVGDWEISVRN